MVDYKLFDKVVAKTFEYFMQRAAEDGAIAISNNLETDDNKYFIEIGKMASHIMGVPFYINLKFFKYWKFKLKNRKLMKGVKRYKEKSEIPLISISYFKVKLWNHFKEENILEPKAIFNDIYKEYYEAK